MKRLAILCMAVAATSSSLVAAAEMKSLVAEAKQVMRQFGGSLKRELVAAMKAGGPIQAIPVCNVRAPEIAATVSKSSGWKVARSSHKLRNKNNAPDAFTKAAIDEFLARQAKGETAGKLVKAAIVTENGKKVFRIVKAIPTGALCLNCHGGNEMNPKVVKLLARYYPGDKARGFKVGQMRGVFTLTKELAK